MMGSAMGHPKVRPVPKNVKNENEQNFQMAENYNDIISNNESTASTCNNTVPKHTPIRLPPINGHRNSFARRKTSIDSLVSQYGLSEEAIAEYKDAFRVCDRNNDGRITAQELGAVLRSLGQTATDSELENLVYNVDEDGNGTIEFDEFLHMMANRIQQNKSENNLLQEAFLVFDRNGDGFISPQEIKLAITSLGEQLTDKELEDMIAMADTNGDGKISFDEFRTVWKMFAQS